MSMGNVTPLRPIRKLIPLIPDSDVSRLIAEAYALAASEPRILELIDSDRDAYAISKKRDRLEDQAWLSSRGSLLPGFDDEVDANWATDLELGSGRPRMPAILVLTFILCRGYFGGFKDRKTATNLAESRTLEIVLANLGINMPGASTIIDNANAVQTATLEFIVDAQIRQVLFEGLDDFKKLTFDSTKVVANSTFPTDSGLIAGLLERAEHMLRLLADHGITLRLPAITGIAVKTIRDLHQQIQLSCGKKNGAKKRVKLYRKLMREARKARKNLLKAYERAEGKFYNLDFLPSERKTVATLIEWIDVDLQNLAVTIVNTDKRINRNEKVPAGEKVVSLSDQDAAMIVKGEREPVVGYKPQLGRSENGFVTAIIVPVGNAADSGQLRPIVDASITRTGVAPSVLSFDDGYTNRADREHYLGLGIGVVSFSGSKGKNIIPAAEYDSQPYKDARNDRSAVESLIFTLKHNHDMDRVMRRGIDSVRSELLEKAIAYNFFRLITLRQRRKQRDAA